MFKNGHCVWRQTLTYNRNQCWAKKHNSKHWTVWKSDNHLWSIISQNHYTYSVQCDTGCCSSAVHAFIGYVEMRRLIVANLKTKKMSIYNSRRLSETTYTFTVWVYFGKHWMWRCKRFSKIIWVKFHANFGRYLNMCTSPYELSKFGFMCRSPHNIGVFEQIGDCYSNY